MPSLRSRLMIARHHSQIGVRMRLSYLVRGLALVAACAAATLVPVRAAGPDSIVFAWPGPLTIGFAPWVFAQDLGFFKEENLDMSVVNLDGSGVILPQV